MRTIVDHWVQIVDVTSVTKKEYCGSPTRDGAAQILLVASAGLSLTPLV
jgi:hypothetical protein